MVVGTPRIVKRVRRQWGDGWKGGGAGGAEGAPGPRGILLASGFRGDTFLFILHLHEFDVAVALFQYCMNLNGCCIKQSYDVVAEILLFASRYFNAFQDMFLMLQTLSFLHYIARVHF